MSLSSELNGSNVDGVGGSNGDRFRLPATAPPPGQPQPPPICGPVVHTVPELDERLRWDWCQRVVAVCQVAAGKVGRGDSADLAQAAEELAIACPSPCTAAERVFLRDRLREFADAGSDHLHRRFHERYGFTCSGAATRLTRAAWGSGDPTDDPRFMLVEWVRVYARAFDDEHAWPPAVKAARVLRKAPLQRLDLDVLARSVNCSRSALTRSFIREFGQSAGQFLTHLRLQRAIDDLATTEWSVEAIARSVGYQTEASLYVAVRRRLGMTPAAIRSECRNRTAIAEALLFSAQKAVRPSQPV